MFAACAAPDDDLQLSEESQEVSAVYNAIRAQEANFPLPTPQAETVIGTFNGATGAYTGLQSEYDYVIDEITGKPKQIRIIPHVEVDAVHVSVRFNITNRGTQAVSLTVNNVTVNAPAGQSWIAADVEKATSVNWKLVVGTRTKSDAVKIDRPYHVGAGVFTVAALPVSIIYEPPQDAGLNNKATYSVTKSIASTFTMSVKEESSTTKSAKPTKYQSVAQINTAISNLVSVLKYAPNVPNKAAIISAFNAISSALGSVSATQTNGTSTSTEASLTVKDTWSASLSTNAHMGPGSGDRIIYLRNAQFVWVADRGKLHIALLAYDSHVTEWVQVLKDDLAALGPFPMRNEGVGPATGLPRGSLQALLALDPFVAGGPQAALNAPRFVPAEPARVEGSGGVDVYTISHEVIASDKTASTNYSTVVTDARSGWLKFLGLGVTETSSTRLTTTHAQSSELTISEKVSTSIELHASGTERYEMDVFYDVVFGTFLFRAVP
jgi:hypothetical protein